MKFYVVLSTVALSLLLQGCDAPAREATGEAEPASQVAAPIAASAPQWFEVVEDPRSEAPLRKSPADDRDYRFRVLENGMKVLLISDPDADKGAASLSIDIGSFDNPRDREGLAHFLEHMLFLGTDKYPEPGEYQAFLTEHGGAFNAYTSLEETNYFFDIDPAYLVPTLDRFSRFFVAPLFNEEYVDRERHAVDSEYQLKIKDDSRREWDVLRELANPEHPFSLFSVGSLETLKNSEEDPVREDLIAFYEKYYTASRMNLVVLGREPLDELQTIVEERFSPVPSHELALPTSTTPLFSTPLPKKVSIRPEKEIRALSFNFPMPSLREDWGLKPAHYFGHLLGHEGPGSLLAVLKARGLAEGLSSGLVFDSRHGALFSVRIQLTSSGVAQEDAVTGLFFRWLELVKSEGIEAWRYEEVARMSEISFQFMEQASPMGYVARLSNGLHHYPPAEILRADFLFEGFDKDRLEAFASHLAAGNAAIVMMAPEVTTDRATALYGAPYAVQPLDVDTLVASAPDSALNLPEANPYIPDHLALIEPQQGQDRPRSLDVNAPTWHFGHNPFATPKAYFEARVAVPGEPDIATAVAREFVLALVMDELSPDVYPAMLAGLNFSLDPWERGYRLTIAGFDQKQGVLLERLLAVLQNPDWNPDRVSRVRDTLLRRWRNAEKDWPLRQLFARFPPLLKDDWLPGQKATQLEAMAVADIRKVHGAMVAGVGHRFYGAGNLDEGGMKALTTQVMGALEPAGEPVSAAVEIVDLKPAETLFATHFHVDHNDSATLLYLQGQADNLAERASFALLEMMASAPFYSSLRTEKQLGYAVGSSISPLLKVPGMMFYVQSPKVDAVALRSEIDGFFQELAGRVEDLTQADLDRYRNAVLATVEQKPMNLNELAQRHLESLNLGYEGFDFRDRLAAALRAVTLEQFKTDFARVLLGERTGFWVLTTRDESAGYGESIPADQVEGAFSYDH